MTGQKEAVVDLVKAALGVSFKPGVHKALDLLTESQIASIQSRIEQMIQSGQVSYGKDASNTSELRRYVRGMVMNHLKKAKELNGGVGHRHISNSSENESAEDTVEVGRHKGVDLVPLPDELKELVKKL